MEPRKVNAFLRFHLNRWVAQATAWIPVDWWDQCDEPMPSDEDLAACPCAVVGIDMAQKIDLAAAVAVFRLPLAHDTDETTVTVVDVDDRGDETTRQLSLNYRIAIVPAFWLPEETLRDRVRQDNVPYDVWAEQGLLHPVEGAIVSSEPIVRYLVDLLQRFSMLHQSEFAYDPAFATEVGVRLRDHHNLQIVEVPQNFTHLSEACLVFEALVKARRVVHGGHRLLRWCVENVAVKRDDAGRIRPVKPRRATKRIDGVSATIIALTRLILQPEAPEISPVVGWIPFG